MSVIFDALAAPPDCDHEMACAFLFELHRSSPGWVVVTRIHDDPHTVFSFDGTLAEVLKTFVEHAPRLVRDDQHEWQVYTAVSTHRSRPARDSGGYRRGGIDSVLAVPGVWADLDRKEGSFDSRDAILRFLDGMPRPTIAVDSGSGGVHAYWLFSHQPLDAGGGGVLSEMWWTLLSERAAELGADIDATYPVDRILRVPGTVRWPKLGKGEMCAPALVRTLWLDGPRYDWRHLDELATPAWRRARAQVAETRARVTQLAWSADLALRADVLDGEMGWLEEGILQLVQDWYNAHRSWDEVFAGTGWTKVLDHEGNHKGDRAGRLFWARPGQTDKSASVGYQGEDGNEVPALALHSLAPETGLLALKRAGVKLTRFRVRAQLAHDGDVLALARETLREMNGQ